MTKPLPVESGRNKKFWKNLPRKPYQVIQTALAVNNENLMRLRFQNLSFLSA